MNYIINKPAEDGENKAQMKLLFCSISSQVAIPNTSFKIRSVTLPMPPICTYFPECQITDLHPKCKSRSELPNWNEDTS